MKEESLVECICYGSGRVLAHREGYFSMWETERGDGWMRLFASFNDILRH